MRNLTSLRDAGSFIAGLLIGLSLVTAVFAMTVVETGRGQMVAIIIAPLVLALGLVLQVVMTRPSPRRTPSC
jgi:formate/nitrite transporter FocA (FNT family)